MFEGIIKTLLGDQQAAMKNAVASDDVLFLESLIQSSDTWLEQRYDGVLLVDYCFHKGAFKCLKYLAQGGIGRPEYTSSRAGELLVEVCDKPNNLENVRKLLSIGISPDSSKDEVSALGNAVKRNDLLLVRELVQAGANVTTSSAKGSYFAYAVEQKYADVAREMMKGKPPMTPEFLTKALREIIHPFNAQPLDISLMKDIVKAGADINSPDAFVEQFAYRFMDVTNRFEAWQAMIECGMDIKKNAYCVALPIETCDDRVLELIFDNGPSQQALDNGLAKAAEMLPHKAEAERYALTVLDKGANPNITYDIVIGEADNDREPEPTAPEHIIFQALKSGPVTKAMVEHGADKNAISYYGMPAICYAIKNGYEQGARELLAGGADLAVMDKEGLDPLYYASISENPEFATMLLASGVKFEQSALNRAVSAGHADVIKIFSDAKEGRLPSREDAGLANFWREKLMEKVERQVETDKPAAKGFV